jgi:hypothetical protein
MKRISFAAFLLTLAALSTFGGPASDMVEVNPRPGIKSDPDKAVLLIGRRLPGKTTTFYLDDSLIGRTNSGDYFITRVEPGTHWIYVAMFDAWLQNCGRLTFEKGKVYYVVETSTFNQVLSAVSPEDFDKYLKENAERAVAYMPKKIPNRLNPDKMKDMQKKFLEKCKNSPDLTKDFVNYSGYPGPDAQTAPAGLVSPQPANAPAR